VTPRSLCRRRRCCRRPSCWPPAAPAGCARWRRRGARPRAGRPPSRPAPPPARPPPRGRPPRPEGGARGRPRCGGSQARRSEGTSERPRVPGRGCGPWRSPAPAEAHLVGVRLGPRHGLPQLCGSGCGLPQRGLAGVCDSGGLEAGGVGRAARRRGRSQAPPARCTTCQCRPRSHRRPASRPPTPGLPTPAPTVSAGASASSPHSTPQSCAAASAPRSAASYAPRTRSSSGRYVVTVDARKASSAARCAASSSAPLPHSAPDGPRSARAAARRRCRSASSPAASETDRDGVSSMRPREGKRGAAAVARANRAADRGQKRSIGARFWRLLKRDASFRCSGVSAVQTGAAWRRRRQAMRRARRLPSRNPDGLPGGCCWGSSLHPLGCWATEGCPGRQGLRLEHARGHCLGGTGPPFAACVGGRAAGARAGGWGRERLPKARARCAAGARGLLPTLRPPRTSGSTWLPGGSVSAAARALGCGRCAAGGGGGMVTPAPGSVASCQSHMGLAGGDARGMGARGGDEAKARRRLWGCAPGGGAARQQRRGCTATQAPAPTATVALRAPPPPPAHAPRRVV
jgi:hypothetical protein